MILNEYMSLGKFVYPLSGRKYLLGGVVRSISDYYAQITWCDFFPVRYYVTNRCIRINSIGVLIFSFFLNKYYS